MLLFPLYVIYILRFTLKSICHLMLDSKIWNVIYLLAVVLAIGLTLGFYFWDLLGLSIFGLCSVTFIRRPDISYVLPAAMLAVILLFMFTGLFTLRYFKKHMPNTIGLRRKKYKENKILSYYIIGFSVYLSMVLIINVVELFNCRQPNP